MREGWKKGEEECGMRKIKGEIKRGNICWLLYNFPLYELSHFIFQTTGPFKSEAHSLNAILPGSHYSNKVTVEWINSLGWAVEAVGTLFIFLPNTQHYLKIYYQLYILKNAKSWFV